MDKYRLSIHFITLAYTNLVDYRRNLLIKAWLACYEPKKNNEQLKILHITASYKPTFIYAGPIYTVATLCETLKEAKSKRCCIVESWQKVLRKSINWIRLNPFATQIKFLKFTI